MSKENIIILYPGQSIILVMDSNGNWITTYYPKKDNIILSSGCKSMGTNGYMI